MDEVKLCGKDAYIEIDILLDDKKIGFAEINSGTRELCRFEIFEPFRDKGYGQKVLGMLIDRYDIQKLWVDDNNERAIHVYEKAGFSKVKPVMYEMERKK